MDPPCLCISRSKARPPFRRARMRAVHVTRPPRHRVFGAVLTFARMTVDVHGPYEVPAKFRELFPVDPQCAHSGDNPTCCGVTGRDATNVSEGHCSWQGKDGICKCNGGFTGFQPAGLSCPPGGQCTREYMLGMLASLDSQIGNVTAAIHKNGLYANSVIVFSSDKCTPSPLPPSPSNSSAAKESSPNCATRNFVAPPLAVEALSAAHLSTGR